MKLTGKANLATARPTGSPATAAQTSEEFPPPRTDRPRPHVCGVCKRPFARLEHLKRHERSHTKEKPFKCNECQRCFARRDLLLRHQQKLHTETAPQARPRAARRDSHSGVVPGPKVRKNSIAAGGAASGRAIVNQNGTNSSMRPRANTISHVDNHTLNMLQNPTSAGLNGGRPMGTLGGLNAGTLNLHQLHGPGSQFAFRGMSSNMSHSGHLPDLRLDTSVAAGLDMSSGLHTAPILSNISELGMESMFYGPGTINPAALHYMDSPTGMAGTPASPFPSHFGNMRSGGGLIDDDESLYSVNMWSGNHAAHHHRSQSMGAGVHPGGELDFGYGGSSPSVISSTGHDSLISDVLLDASSNSTAFSTLNATTSSPGNWNGHPAMMTPPLTGSSAMGGMAGPGQMTRHQPQQSLPSSLAAVSLTQGTLVPSPPAANVNSMFSSIDSPTPSALSLSYSGPQHLHQSFMLDSSPVSTPGGGNNAPYMPTHSPDMHFGMHGGPSMSHDIKPNLGHMKREDGHDMWSQETMQPMFQTTKREDGVDMWS